MTVRFSSRKFIGAAVVFGVATALIAVGKISGGEWVTISTLTLGIYTGGNIMGGKNE